MPRFGGWCHCTLQTDGWEKCLFERWMDVVETEAKEEAVKILPGFYWLFKEWGNKKRCEPSLSPIENHLVLNDGAPTCRYL